MGDLTANFSRWEFACKCGCGLDTIDAGTVSECQAVRDHFDRKVTVTSGSRCEAYNKAIGGFPDSQHKHCRAADIVVDQVPAHLVQEFFEQQGVGGLGSYDDFTHVDTRKGRARWGNRRAANA